MRKILISVLVILLIVMAGLIVFKGLSIGNFKILGTSQIIEENDNLTQEIAETEAIMNGVYPKKTEELDTSVSKLLTAKQEYLDLADVSTKEELEKANIVETYTVEFLWTRLGRHATSEGVNLNYKETGNNTIEFTVTGEYIPILSFVSAIENDSKLGFTIENFKLVPSGDFLQATFVTRNVKIKTEQVTKVQTTETNSNETTNNETNTETSNQTNTGTTAENNAQ